tara:strand:- start:5169 stop:5711 length:543 start_codon:yes stop_codon:yes gene_type:complete
MIKEENSKEIFELLHWEQAVPERDFVIIDFLRSLSSNLYESIIIVNADILYALCALHFKVKKITWYSKQDILDKFFLAEGHKRIEKPFGAVSPKESDLIVFSMNEVLASPFPERYLMRMLCHTKKTALVLNTLVAFDEKGQAVKSKERFDKIFEPHESEWVITKSCTTHFNGFYEIRRKN